MRADRAEVIAYRSRPEGRDRCRLAETWEGDRLIEGERVGARPVGPALIAG
jgi:hypothetical protein